MQVLLPELPAADGEAGSVTVKMLQAINSCLSCRETTSGWKGTTRYPSAGIISQPLEEVAKATRFRASWVGKQRALTLKTASSRLDSPSPLPLFKFRKLISLRLLRKSTQRAELLYKDSAGKKP